MPVPDGVTIDPKVVTIQVTPVFQSTETNGQTGNESSAESRSDETTSESSSEEKTVIQKAKQLLQLQMRVKE